MGVRFVQIGFDMALAFYINGPDDIAHAFAAHDEYLAIFTHYYFRSRKEDVRALRPDVDDYYSAPYCFLSWKDGGSSTRDGGFLVFACMVPYLHGNPWTRENVEYQTMDDGTRAHHQAGEWMKQKGTFKGRTPHVGTVEKFQTEMKLGYNDGGVYTFTADGGYPTWKDVSESLEDGAVGVICSAMKWKVPTHWRGVRKQIEDLHNIPILDLALWDKEKKQQLQQLQQQPLLLHSQQKDQEGDDVEEYDEESRSSSNSRIQQMDENETANLLLGLGGNRSHTTEYSNNDKYEYDDYNDNSNDDYDDIDDDYDEFYDDDDDDDDDDDTNDRATKIQRNEEEQQQQQQQQQQQSYGWYNNSNSGGGGGDDNNNKNVVHNDYEQEEEKKEYSSSNNNVCTTQV